MSRSEISSPLCSIRGCWPTNATRLLLAAHSSLLPAAQFISQFSLSGEQDSPGWVCKFTSSRSAGSSSVNGKALSTELTKAVNFLEDKAPSPFLFLFSWIFYPSLLTFLLYRQLSLTHAVEWMDDAGLELLT